MEYTVKLLPPAVEFLKSLPVKLAAKAYRTVSLLQTFGFQLGEPHAKTLVGTGGLKELRVKLGSDICRIFYFHHHKTVYVATSGYIKKDMKTDTGEIARALRLRQLFEEEETV